MYRIRAMTIEDYDAVMGLWQVTEGIGLSQANSRKSIAAYLERNPGMSAVVFSETGALIGAVLCGHDGRRGLLHHLVVHPGTRRQGIGRVLVDYCLDQLRQAGIDKCHLFVFTTNENARAFWKHERWYERPELVLMSRDIPEMS